MNSLDDEIRGALRTEAARLREVRPLHLPPAVRDEPRAVPGASLARRLSAWRGPIAAVAAVVLIAAVLVIVRSVGKEQAAPVAPPSPVAGPPLPAGATPRYYVMFGAAGTSLLAASRVVWSQYVPAPPHGSNPAHAPQVCGTPFLTGNGQVVVCAASSYSARDKRLSAVWLAYPLAAPTQPRVLGSVQQPQDVSHFDFNSVDWTNPSGTEIIGTWYPTVVNSAGVTTTNFSGFIGHGAVRPFAPPPGAVDLAW